MFLKRRLPSFQRCLGKPYKVFPSRERAMGIQRSVSYLRIFWPAACKKWMILQLLNKLSGKSEPQKLFPKTSSVRRIYNLVDSGWEIDGIFSVYTVWADIATGSVIFLWDPDYCYGLWADETTFAYGRAFQMQATNESIEIRRKISTDDNLSRVYGQTASKWPSDDC